jgi:hypothetical protein
MRRFHTLLLLFLIAVAPAFSSAAKTGSTRHSAVKSAPKAKSKNSCASCSRNAKGRIARSPTARHSFQKTHPCPSTGRTTGSCPGYVIDHVVPLKRGGADAPANMQWQTTAAAKAKDRIE